MRDFLMAELNGLSKAAPDGIPSAAFTPTPSRPTLASAASQSRQTLPTRY
jgi:hypothetical protein